MSTTQIPICQYVNDPSLSPEKLAGKLEQFRKLDSDKCIVYLEHNGQFFRNGAPIEQQAFRQQVQQAGKAGTLQTFNTTSED